MTVAPFSRGRSPWPAAFASHKDGVPDWSGRSGCTYVIVSATELTQAEPRLDETQRVTPSSKFRQSSVMAIPPPVRGCLPPRNVADRHGGAGRQHILPFIGQTGIVRLPDVETGRAGKRPPDVDGRRSPVLDRIDNQGNRSVGKGGRKVQRVRRGLLRHIQGGHGIGKVARSSSRARDTVPPCTDPGRTRAASAPTTPLNTRIVNRRCHISVPAHRTRSSKVPDGLRFGLRHGHTSHRTGGPCAVLVASGRSSASGHRRSGPRSVRTPSPRTARQQERQGWPARPLLP